MPREDPGGMEQAAAEGQSGRLCAVSSQLGALGCLEGKPSLEEPAEPTGWLQAMSCVLCVQAYL